MANADDESLDQPQPVSIPLEYGQDQKLSLDPSTQKQGKKKCNLVNKKTRRGNGRKKRNKLSKTLNFSLLGTNCNGITNKQDSLRSAIMTFKPSIVNLQETKVRKYGSLKLKGYQIFEKIRKDGNGGGLLTAADENLNPVLISTGREEDSEILTIQVKAGGYDIRIINGYGPQEAECDKENVYKFWQEIEDEILKAKDDNCLILIQLDANAKIGREKIKEDPNNESPNGRIFLDIVDRQNLTIANTLELCKGVITRERVTLNKVEKSVIDYIVVCEEMKKYLEEMIIDDDRFHVLTKYAGKQGGKKKILSDHNIMFSKFSIQCEYKRKTIRKEFFNLKDKEGQAAFLKQTSFTEVLSKSFSPNRSFAHNANIFNRNLNSCIQKCFKKIRITSGGKWYMKDGNNLIIDKIKLKTRLQIFLKNCSCLIGRKIAGEKLNEIENFLNENCSARNAETVKAFIHSAENEDGNFSQLKLWKLKQKLCPKPHDPPMAKKDDKGNLITSPELLKNLYLKTYQDRLRSREMKIELSDIFFLKEELWASRLIELRNQTTPPWTKKQLKKALNSLKKNKTADPNGLINEIFMEGCAGEDLENALLALLNGIKFSFHFPEYVLKENITTIFKNKGSRLELDNDRGIFILSSLKKILDKMIYLDKFEDIDRNMSNSNIGARRGRNIKDHLFIIYGIINSVINGHEESVDIQIYDLVKAFDSLWLEDCMNDAYDTLSSHNRDEKVALLYESNKKNLVAVNTSVGLTDRVNIPKIVQQGGTWGPCLCSNSVDTLGKKIRDRGEATYKYKDTVRVLPLAMVDDINAISKCGIGSVSLNTFVNTQIELKKLKFHVPDKQGKSKCHKMHIGAKKETCPELKVHGTVMENVEEDMYLGDLISSNGKNKKNVEKRISKGLGIITQIMNLLEIVSFGKHYIEIALLLRESMFINGILFNAEVWYGLTKAEVEEFEKLDRLLLRRILQAPVSTPKESYYLELGILPISAVIKQRRIQYLHHLATRNKNEMLSQFFMTQWRNPTRGDWTQTVKENMEEFGIPADFEYLVSKSKDSFKKIVKSKAREFAFEDLLEKKEKHSKMEHLNYTELKIQPYLSLDGVVIEHVRNIFKFRTRMSPFKENFRCSNETSECPLCSSHLDSQYLCFTCPAIREKCEVNCDMDDIYSEDITKEMAETVTKIVQLRENFKEVIK